MLSMLSLHTDFFISFLILWMASLNNSMYGKRSYPFGSNQSRSSKRFKRNRTIRRKTRTYRRRSISRFRSRRSKLVPQYGAKPSTSISRHIYIQGTQRCGPAVPRMFVAMGKKLYFNWYYNWNSSGISGNTPGQMAIMGPYRDVFLATFARNISFGNTSGPDVSGSRGPTSEKYYLSHINIRVVITQNNEDGLVRLCIARRKKVGTHSGATNTIYDDWNTYPEAPVSNEWNVYYNKLIRFDDPVSSPVTNKRTRIFNIYLPMRRIVTTRTGLNPTAETDWYAIENIQNQTYLFLDSSDVTSGDSQTFSAQIYMMNTVYQTSNGVEF